MRDFIELHDKTNQIITISINHICSYREDGVGTAISLVNGLRFIVNESPNEVKCAIIDAKYSVTPRHL